MEEDEGVEVEEVVVVEVEEGVEEVVSSPVDI